MEHRACALEMAATFTIIIIITGKQVQRGKGLAPDHPADERHGSHYPEALLLGRGAPLSGQSPRQWLC